MEFHGISMNFPTRHQVHQPADVCLQAAEDAEAARQQTGLELQDMAGPLIVAVTFCFLGILTMFGSLLDYFWIILHYVRSFWIWDCYSWMWCDDYLLNNSYMDGPRCNS